jgi:protein-S-isoprenylcysteine O-methyltransferase Ste14
MDIRRFLFKNRSFTPIPIILTVIYLSSPSTPYVYMGFVLVITGEVIRFNAVRYAGGATRTTKVGASSLCTAGPYARTRNPLYLGNVIIYAGMVFVAGGIWIWYLLPVIITFFILQYAFIISLEEETLAIKFGGAYKIYSNNVPRLLPRLNAWDNLDRRQPATVKKTLKNEKRTLQNIILISAIILLKPIFF